MNAFATGQRHFWLIGTAVACSQLQLQARAMAPAKILLEINLQAEKYKFSL